MFLMHYQVKVAKDLVAKCGEQPAPGRDVLLTTRLEDVTCKDCLAIRKPQN